MLSKLLFVSTTVYFPQFVVGKTSEQSQLGTSLHTTVILMATVCLDTLEDVINFWTTLNIKDSLTLKSPS